MKRTLTLAAVLSIGVINCTTHTDLNKDWTVYGGSKQNIHYSALREIDTNNVQNLKVAWTYHTGDADTANHSQIQCNPIIVDGILYGTSPQLKLFALDAATGKEKWVFNPYDTSKRKKNFLFFIFNINRGVTYWTDGKNTKRLFYTVGPNLYSIDANTGMPDANFGVEGKIDLHDGLDRDVKTLFVTSTSPGIIYKDLIIVGTRVDEGPAAAPGHIRAFDVHSGKRRWIFHTIPHPGEKGYDTWEDKEAYKHIGGANAWSGFSLDEERGILFAGTGSASFDFYGGKRLGANLFSDCILALDAATGKYIWHFQDIHHDIWDKDMPTPPILVSINRDGKKVDAVAQVTKIGYVYVFERTTGKPLYPISEIPAPTQTELTGEKPWPTQPQPTAPKPFVRQIFTEQEINTLLPDSSIQEIKQRLQSYKTGNLFNPPSKEGTVILPGLDGGAEWGGPSYDPETGLLYVNANEMAWIMKMVDLKDKPKQKETYAEAGKRLYQTNCMACHGAGKEGSGNYPSLINIDKKYKEEQLELLLSTGRRMMPASKQLKEEEKKAIASFVLDDRSMQGKKFILPASEEDPYLKLPYTNTGYDKFLTRDGLPAIRPPWGTLNALDLNKGVYLWRDILGNDTRFKDKGIQTGTENYGGSAVTAGGLLFIAATKDGKFRAFDKRSGQLLWETDLPACGFATPSIYQINGKEYIVIACGGGKLKTKSADAYVAFGL